MNSKNKYTLGFLALAVPFFCCSHFFDHDLTAAFGSGIGGGIVGLLLTAAFFPGSRTREECLDDSRQGL